MPAAPQRSFAQMAKVLALKGEIATTFDALNSLNPDEAVKLVEELAAMCGLSSESGKAPKARESPKFDKVANFFVSNNNAPATRRQIADGTGLEMNTIHTIVYKSRPEDFHRDKRGNDAFFSLKPEPLGEAQRRMQLF